MVAAQPPSMLTNASVFNRDRLANAVPRLLFGRLANVEFRAR